MRYKQKWQKYENFADKINLGGDLAPCVQNSNQPGYDLRDAKVMIAWLKYAATIEDSSYKKIIDQPILKLSDLKRPPISL